MFVAICGNIPNILLGRLFALPTISTKAGKNKTLSEAMSVKIKAFD